MPRQKAEAFARGAGHFATFDMPLLLSSEISVYVHVRTQSRRQDLVSFFVSGVSFKKLIRFQTL